MSTIIYLTKRNMKLYWRDKSTVITSLTSSIIIIALFILFLGRLYINSLEDLVSEFNNTSTETIQALIFSWILAGIIVLNSINIPQTLLSRIILDKESKATNDFYVIPFKRRDLGLSYILSALIVGTTITYVSFLVGELYIFMISGSFFSLQTNLIVLAVTILSTASFSSLLFVIYLFVKSSSAVGGITAITSSVGGFLAGIYITIGSLSGVIKDIVSANPLAHATTMLRNILMQDQMATVFINVPNDIVQEFSDSLAINLYIGNLELSSIHYIISLLVVAVVSIIISYFKLLYDRI
ncbi:ABC transporter permease [Candidatus Xianfuyuplasma coldseepsis]|uniref:ABC transporter permease n=1 Tax=Candidatus Xianfuyuplasma coldseepsis TaxID=2782163 RepID=A0A7L7KQ51_9MOLU|nr:ABC transporter permease [Xianfuyuplasma coldseepsis]QMS84705.1 ABC transporter permease [Xianfuyuplasma coldseepsis]